MVAVYNLAVENSKHDVDIQFDQNPLIQPTSEWKNDEIPPTGKCSITVQNHSNITFKLEKVGIRILAQGGEIPRRPSGNFYPVDKVVEDATFRMVDDDLEQANIGKIHWPPELVPGELESITVEVQISPWVPLGAVERVMIIFFLEVQDGVVLTKRETFSSERAFPAPT